MPRVGFPRWFPGEFLFRWELGFITSGSTLLRRNTLMDESKLVTISKPADGESLCRTCYWAHAQKGFRESEEVAFCAWGPLRKVPFRVRDCTDYLNRTLPTRAQMEKIALIIPTAPARKKAGFSRMGFKDHLEEDESVAIVE